MNAKHHLSSRPLLWCILIGAAVVAAIITGIVLRQPDKPLQSSGGSLPTLIEATRLSSLAETTTPINRSRLANNVTPPTNKWFSGFALQADPKPGYSYPNSFLPGNSGFEFSLPNITATATTIDGPHAPDVVVTIEGATSYKLTAYDELTVELTYYDKDDEPLVKVRTASGLPYIYLRAERNIAISFTGMSSPQDSWTRIESNSSYYGVGVEAKNNRFQLAAGNHTSFFSAPSDTTLDTVARHASALLQSGSVSYTQRGDTFTTTLTYKTLDDQPVLIAKLPHQQKDKSSDVTYQSILGDMTTSSGTTFSFDSTATPVSAQLDLSNISDEHRDLLTTQLRQDIRSFEDKNDTYFGGKQLYRMAQLVMIAYELGEDELAAGAKATLKTELITWLTLEKSDPKSFLYDPEMKGIVGNVASFGSDREFNDHHFHYGYFIYAAAILAEHDAKFFSAHKATVNLLVADIANYNDNESLPLRRVFDPYAGHSWASGTAPFSDGNNQESTSEAMNAWIGTILWAKQTKNQALELQSAWMLSLEHRTAKEYWLLNEGTTPEHLSAYDSPIVSIVWGGKRDYATFFSNEPNAKLAVQLLPPSPSLQHINGTLPKKSLIGTSIDKIYGDYILMATPGATIKQAVNLPDSAIDDGNSRTYLYAYILTS